MLADMTLSDAETAASANAEAGANAGALSDGDMRLRIEFLDSQLFFTVHQAFLKTLLLRLINMAARLRILREYLRIS